MDSQDTTDQGAYTPTLTQDRGIPLNMGPDKMKHNMIDMAPEALYGILKLVIRLHVRVDLTVLLHDKSRVLIDITVSSKPPATLAVVIAIASNMPNTSAPPTGYGAGTGATADILEDTDALCTGKRTWGAKLAVPCHISTCFLPGVGWVCSLIIGASYGMVGLCDTSPLFSRNGQTIKH